MFPIIFQKFDLDLEEMAEMQTPESGAARTLMKDLAGKGYVVLESSDWISGAPESVILGGEVGKGHKNDFYEAAEKVGLRYRSGMAYFNKEI